LGPKPDRILDCIGMYCPIPVLKVREELDKLSVGQLLEVWADDPAAEEDIPRLTKRIGQEILEISKDGSRLRFLLKKVK
jgi:tRNA 2-thiouridine synthesizing protein A